MSTPRPSPELRPGHALLSPAWLLALAVMIANDHWLKGAGLIPELLTGKLSDLAGMLVAPVLLAVVLRVESRRALAACHVAVGLVFAAIQLSPGCAFAWTWLTGLLGHPWTITADPTDLLALPVLLLSWRLLTPHMQPDRSPLVPLQRSAVAGLVALGLWSSLATTQREWEDPGFGPVFGNAYVSNQTGGELAIHVRYLREDVYFVCSQVLDDPGRMLASDAFGEAQHWLLPDGANIGIEFEEVGCNAVWIAGDGLEPTIVFLNTNTYTGDAWAGEHENLAELDPMAGLGLERLDDGRIGWVGGEDVRFTPRTDTLPQPAGCEAPGNESRLDWSSVIPDRPTEILALDLGIDGCFELSLQELSDQSGQVAPVGDPYPFYLCAPEPAVPFVVGDRVAFDTKSNTRGTRELSVLLLDADLSAAEDPNGTTLRLARYLRAGERPSLVGPAVGREIEGVVGDACPWLIEPGCATAQRPAMLQVLDGQNPMPTGAPVFFADVPGPGAMVRTAVVSYVRQIAVNDGACSEGAIDSAWDIDLAVIVEPL